MALLLGVAIVFANAGSMEGRDSVMINVEDTRSDGGLKFNLHEVHLSKEETRVVTSAHSVGIPGFQSTIRPAIVLPDGSTLRPLTGRSATSDQNAPVRLIDAGKYVEEYRFPPIPDDIDNFTVLSEAFLVARTGNVELDIPVPVEAAVQNPPARPIRVPIDRSVSTPYGWYHIPYIAVGAEYFEIRFVPQDAAAARTVPAPSRGRHGVGLIDDSGQVYRLRGRTIGWDVQRPEVIDEFSFVFDGPLNDSVEHFTLRADGAQ